MGNQFCCDARQGKTQQNKAPIKRPREITESKWKPSPATQIFKRCTGYYINTTTKEQYNKREYEKWYYNFAEIDVNEDGVIEREEFVNWLKFKDSTEFNDAKADKMWNKILGADKNNDGVLSWDEFIYHMIDQGYLKPLAKNVGKASIKRPEQIMNLPWKPSPATIRFKRMTHCYKDCETGIKYNK